jgi:hypothetical protein
VFPSPGCRGTRRLAATARVCPDRRVEVSILRSWPGTVRSLGAPSRATSRSPVFHQFGRCRRLDRRSRGAQSIGAMLRRPTSGASGSSRLVESVATRGLDNGAAYAYVCFITPVAPCRHSPASPHRHAGAFELTASGPQGQARQREAIQGNRRLPHRVLHTSTRRGARTFEACAHTRPRLDVLPITAFCRCTLPSGIAETHHVGRRRVDHWSRSLPRPSSRPEEGARETRQRPLRQQPARHPSC